MSHDGSATEDKVTFVVVFVRGYDGRETPDREGVRTNQILARLDGILCG
jgi:hypothetical protein